MEIDVDSAQVKIPPPFVFMAFVIVAFLLRALIPAPFLSESTRWGLGSVVVLVAFSFMLSAVIVFRKSKTNIEPWKPSLLVVRQGPYRFSRNPMYVSFLLMALGFALLANNFYALFLLPVLYLFLRYYVIAREERYLEGKFGEDYRAFCQTVRRWL